MMIRAGRTALHHRQQLPGHPLDQRYLSFHDTRKRVVVLVADWRVAEQVEVTNDDIDNAQGLAGELANPLGNVRRIDVGDRAVNAAD